jgi:glycerol-3-phosphate O-acyltransferase/dihydroxyacetone phosphate acyltransferase
VLVSLGVVPTMYGIYAIVAAIIAAKANAPMKWRVITPIVVLVALPFTSFAALKFGEAGMDVLK